MLPEASEEGAKEGAAFIKEHIINVTDKAFDDFAHAGIDQATNRRLLELRFMSNRNPIRLGMVGGGKDAFIGEVHRAQTRWKIYL